MASVKIGVASQTETSEVSANPAAISRKHEAGPASESIRLRRQSMLPAGTIDPLIRNPTFADTLLILTAVDAHLASGFSTTYPDQLSNYCAEAVWSNFINDINTAAKLKAKDRFVIRLRPVLRHIKGLGKALDIQLEKRTTPILDVLQYWRDILKTYGIQVELRKGGAILKKKPIHPHVPKKKKSSKKVDSNSGDSAVNSSNNSVDEGMSRSGSIISLQSLAIKPPFLQGSTSEVSVASTRNSSSPDSYLSGKWELVVFTGFKRRSQAASLYSVNRRSTYSLHQTSDSRRPATVCMVGTEEIPSLSRPHTPRNRRSMSSSMSSSTNRRSRAKVLSLEELAKLPLPVPSSPFTKSEPNLSMSEDHSIGETQQKRIVHDIASSSHKHQRSASSSMIQWSRATEEQQAMARSRQNSMTFPGKVAVSNECSAKDEEHHSRIHAASVSMPNINDIESMQSASIQRNVDDTSGSIEQPENTIRRSPVEILVTLSEGSSNPIEDGDHQSVADGDRRPANLHLVQTFVCESSLSSSDTNPVSAVLPRSSTVMRSPLSKMSHTPDTLNAEQDRKYSKVVRRSSSFANLISAASDRIGRSLSNFGFSKDDSGRRGENAVLPAGKQNGATPIHSTELCVDQKASYYTSVSQASLLTEVADRVPTFHSIPRDLQVIRRNTSDCNLSVVPEPSALQVNT